MNNEELNKFMQLKGDFDTMLKRLQELSDDHFNKDSDKISWGDIGDMEAYVKDLKEVTDRAFNEGECAA